MISQFGFRATLIALAVVVGGLGIASMITDVSAARAPASGANDAGISRTLLSRWIAPMSGADLDSGRALAHTLEMLRQSAGRPVPAEDDRERSALRGALSLSPHDAQLWLALAAFEVARDPDGPAGIEPLKMSYFTAPNDARLMPMRLEVATRMADPVDVQLRLLVEGDLRLMLTRQPDQGAAVLAAYRRASIRGKAFMDDAVRSIAPSFLRAMHG
jgi:hypothetical protein